MAARGVIGDATSAATTLPRAATGAPQASTDLPPALAPWSAELSLFPRELALHLGSVVRRLASLIGEALPSRQGSGDPDGFDGLARRGPYDRLLQSEWLFADELPDEFARRAVMHEHLFLELARQHPVQHPLAVALFDCGPSQLGAPRLVHIAALVVLARRAAAAQATFRWGLVQRPNLRLFDGVTPANILRLLEARTHAEASDIEIGAWEGLLAEGEKIGELWFVGPQRLARFPEVRRQWHLVTEEVLSPGARQVSAAVRHDSRNDSPAILQLPPNDACVRLLRDPFEVAVAPPAPVDATHAIVSNVVFGAGGRALLGRASDGALIVHPYANSARPKAQSNVPKPRKIELPPGSTLVAAGWLKGRHPVFVVSDAEGLQFCDGSRFRTTRAPWPRGGVLPAVGSVEDPGPLQPCFRYGNGNIAFFDRHGTLWNKPDAPILERKFSNVFALRVRARTLSFIRRIDSDWEIEGTIRVPGAGTTAFYGFAPEQSLCFAVEQSNGRWHSHSDGRNETIAPPPGCTVVGTIGTGPRGQALICVEGDRRTVMVVGGGVFRLTKTASPIVHATASIVTPHLALVMENGDLEVHSIKKGNPQRILRARREPTP